VRREIIKIITPGCIDEIEGLPGDQPNYIMAAYEDPKSKKWAAAITDISTGELRLGQLENFDQVRSCAADFSPKELLIRKFSFEQASKNLRHLIDEKGLLLDILPEQSLSDKSEQDSSLEEIFGKTDLDHFPCSKSNGKTILGGKEVISALFIHLKNLKANLSVFRTVNGLKDPETLTLGETLIRDLEIFETARRREAKGSLFKQIDRTLSPMGARLSRWSFSRPLLRKESISARHDSVEKIASLGEEEMTKLREIIKGSFDLERLTTRVLSGAASPAELSKIRETLRKVASIDSFLTESKISFSKEGYLVPFLKDLKKHSESLKILEDALIDFPENLGKGDLVFRKKYDEKLDGLVGLSQNGKEKVNDYEKLLRTETKITNLKVKPHKTFGLLIEVTKSNISKVPDSFIRRQTMVNCERFMTNELKDLDETLSSALDNSIDREIALYQILIEQLAAKAGDIYQVAHGLSQLDMLQSFAWLAIKENYCRPQIAESEEFHLINSRHPVVENFVGKHEFVANSIEMNKEKKHLLITGPNMAGKSTVMRQTAICAILNQAGCFVPAEKAVMPIFDQIYTRVGASDDLSKGQSTFMVEMSEAADILRQATKNSLVILDEVGRGTSTQDGLAIAAAILENLATKINCWSLFATHYHELAEIGSNFEHVKNMKTEVIEKKDGIEFSHRLREGVSGSSFGIEVAKLAGIPSQVIKRAQNYLALCKNSQAAEKSQTSEKIEIIPPEEALTGQLELGLQEFVSEKSQQEVCLPIKDRQLDGGKHAESSLKSASNPNFEQILKKLQSINMNHISPMKAFGLLNEIKKLSEQGENVGFFNDAFVFNETKPH